MSDKTAAAKLTQILVRQGGALDSFVAEIEGECNEVQFVKYKRIVGKIMGSMLLHGINVNQMSFPI